MDSSFGFSSLVCSIICMGGIQAEILIVSSVTICDRIYEKGPV